MLEKRKQRIFDKTQEAGYIDQAETLKTSLICQTFASPVVLTPLVTVFVSDQRYVAQTDQGNVYTIAMNKWSSAKPMGVVSKHALGSIEATKTALSLQIDGEEKLYAYLFQFAPMKEIVEAINGARTAGST
jgi:hypothetical protein